VERQHGIWILTYLACVCALIWPALYNGYPLLYSDTASYVASGMRLETPVDRPITYGLFIRITSIGGFTLWTTIASQAALMVRLIELLLRRLRPYSKPAPGALALIVLVLALTTSLPWVVSQVMADIYTPMMVLCMILLVLSNEVARHPYQRVLLYLLFFFTVAAHLSHPVLAVILLSVIFVLRWGLRRWTGIRLAIRSIGIMFGLAIAAYPIMGSATAKSGNVLFMGSMVEHGVARAFLEEHCANETYKLCAWKDRFPERAFQFHWDQSGAIGSYSGWPEASEEFGHIIRGTLTEPKYIALHIKASLAATWKQLGMYEIGDGWGSFKEGSGVYYILERHMRHDMRAMTTSRQYGAEMAWIQGFKPVHIWGLRVALVVLLPLLIMAFRSRNAALITLFTLVLSGTVLSAWGSGTFSGEVDRFGCKMIWLLPMLLLLATGALVQARKLRRD